MRISFEYRLKSGKRLSGVTGGNLAYSVAQTIKSGGTLSVVNPPATDWLNEEISVTAFVDAVPLPLGVFIPAAPVETYTGTGAALEIQLADRLALLDSDAFAETYSVPAGTEVVSYVVGLLDGHEVTVNGGTETLANPMFWEAGTSRLRVVNDLLDAAGYFSLWCDGNGYFRVEKYVRPQDRGVMDTFTYGELNQLTQRDQDIFSIPNRFVAVGTGDPIVGALVGVAVNNNPDSPFSYPARGRWITQVESGVEATSQEVLDAYAQRRLQEVTAVSATVQVEHLLKAPLLNQTVQVTHTPSGLDALHTVQRIEIPLSATALCKTTLREVAQV